MRGIGCLLFLALFALLLAEGWIAAQAATLFGRVMGFGGPDYLSALLLIAALSVVGWVLMRRRMAALPMALMGGGDFGRLAVGVVGCFLLVFPGLLTGLIGLCLQIPLAQRLFARSAGTILGTVIRQAAARMGKQMPGNFPGGGFPGGGFPGGGFPGAGGFPGGPGGPGGGRPLQPDQRKRGGRTYEVENENRK
ncbi:MAG: hypothetical protein ACOCXJ_03840 [Planctomycetota bacterium]